MGKRDDREKTKGERSGIVMGIVLVAVVLLCVVFLIFGSTFTKWGKSLISKIEENKADKSSSVSSVVDSSSSGETDELTYKDRYIADEEQLDPSYQLAAPKTGEKIAVITTSQGVMKLRLFADKAPKSVENFISKSTAGYYNGLKIKTVFKDLIFQTEGDENTIHGQGFEDEFSVNLHNYYGAVGVVNRQTLDTNTNQFYIVSAPTVPDDILTQMATEDARAYGLGFSDEVIAAYREHGGYPQYDGKYTVFGQIYEGLDIVAKINSAEVSDEESGTPVTDITITSIVIEEI